MAFSLNKQIAHCNLPFNWLTSLVMDLAACVICGAQNDTNECHLADFTVDAVSANHFMASYHPNGMLVVLTIPGKISKMAGNSGSYPFDSCCVDRL